VYADAEMDLKLVYPSSKSSIITQSIRLTLKIKYLIATCINLTFSITVVFTFFTKRQNSVFPVPVCFHFLKRFKCGKRPGHVARMHFEQVLAYS